MASVLALFACDMTRAMGPPGDVVEVASDTGEGLARLLRRAWEPWGAPDRWPAMCEVVEVWRLRADAPHWGGEGGQMERVAVMRWLHWYSHDGQPLEEPVRPRQA